MTKRIRAPPTESSTSSMRGIGLLLFRLHVPKHSPCDWTSSWLDGNGLHGFSHPACYVVQLQDHPIISISDDLLCFRKVEDLHVALGCFLRIGILVLMVSRRSVHSLHRTACGGRLQH
jgi:hypothetical protein